MSAMEADYVIVGAGSAGCAVAWRLAEAGRSVLVIEHGGTDAGPLIAMPGALSLPMGMARYDWGYRTEPEPGLDGRRLAAPRGKVLGGSSAINGMVWVRGHARDYDAWREAGAEGWGFADVLPYFRRLEGLSDVPAADPAWRGTEGPVRVTRGRLENPLFGAFLEAARQAGYAPSPDLNGERQEGMGALERTVWRGRRWSAADAYLRPARATGRCRVVRALARRVRIEDGRATGVETDRGFVAARGEVVLAASAFNSPKLLMLSGIGPAAHLAEHGIETVADRPGVGEGLQDHLEVYVQWAARRPVSLRRHWSLFGRALAGARWLATRGGPGGSNQFEAGGFLRSRAGVAWPDLMIHFLPLAVRYDGRAAAPGHGFQAHVGPTRSPARGRVRLRSGDPAAPPTIRFAYMRGEGDRETFRAGIRLVREIAAQPALADFVAREIAPGPEATDDAALDAFVRAHAESAYHPCGTCRMGRRDDPRAVVDPEVRVIGVEGLRVADSSTFPTIPNANLNATAIMVGEKAADHLLGRAPLPAANVAPWTPADWRTAQR